MSLISTINKQFALDVQKGLSAQPKTLPSKYFYDKQGDALFQQIMQLEEYYPTRCEYEIFDTYKMHLLDLFQKNSDKPFKLIEFGAGDGHKTKVLLDYFTKKDQNFQYVPIDISRNVLNVITNKFSRSYPSLDIQAFHGDYFEALKSLETDQNYRKVVLFMGSNIGNFSNTEAVHFLQQIHQRLSKGDLVVIGVDLKKYPQRILDAYNDKKGVTRDFNHNLLKRINRELGGNFRIDNFLHYPTYNPQTGDAQSYLVAKEPHEVHIKALNQRFTFDAWESIYTEISKKYSVKEVEVLARESGFQLIQHFFDRNKYFVDTVWQKN